MNLTIFQELSDKIEEECSFLPLSKQEQKAIQIIDLYHFKQCYDHYFKIIEYIGDPINIIEVDGIKKGIFFYDIKHDPIIDFSASEIFKKQHKLKEIWFVSVEEEDSFTNLDFHINFLIDKKIHLFYEKIFIFDFFKSVIFHLR